MSSKPIHSALFAGAAVAIALAISPAASAAQPDVNAPNTEPIVIAQAAGTPAAGAAMRTAAIDPDLGAVNWRGVRKAALQGPDELRRYIFRTRMIYNFDYEDWAPKQ